MSDQQFEITEADLHPHLQSRMKQRGVTLAELKQVLNEGQEAAAAKPGTYGKVLVTPYAKDWEGQFYVEKEITVYYKLTEGRQLVVLTVLARYGQGFPDNDS
jgi:hypothetical protein